MYRVGSRSRVRRRRIVLSILACMIALALLGVGLFVQRLLDPKTTVSQSKAVITTVKAKVDPTRTYDEAVFTIDLPDTWKVGERSTAPYNVYRWKGISKSQNAVQLEIYQDTIPVNFVVNHVLALEANDNHVMADGDVSDNCANFTKDTSPTRGASGARGKWRGIDFLCDLNNTSRNVVGTSSAGGINSVNVKGPSNIMHTFFFTYTEYSLSPDYQTLYNAINSFRVK